MASTATHAPPSPRTRGEGWGEGALPLPEHCQIFSIPPRAAGRGDRRRRWEGRLGIANIASADNYLVTARASTPLRVVPSPAPFQFARADKRSRSRGAIAPGACGRQRTTTKGSGAPQGAPSTSAHASANVADAGGAAAGLSAPARLPALHNGACRSERTLQLSPGRASRDRQATRALPAPPIALKRNTPRAGRNAGGNDARTAREQGYKPRPQEPHSPYPSAVTGRHP